MDNEKTNRTKSRKGEHIDICLRESVTSQLSTGFEYYHFQHNPIPELDFSAINPSTSFLGKGMKVPFLVSSMTGGTDQARHINGRLAEVAEARGWGIGVGSMRAALESEEWESFQIRKYAPTIPVLANLGTVQLNKGYGLDECSTIVDRIEADGLVLHLNPMQEVFQPEGDTDFSGLLSKIEQITRLLDVPVGVKEVGMGIDGDAARKLVEVGVSFIDVAGAGGTSWVQVEKYRNKDRVRYDAAEAFQDWGTPTAVCLEEIRSLNLDTTVIASGGMNNGVEAAKAIGLGSHLVGFGRALLPSAVNTDTAEINDQFERIEFELKAAMFGAGIPNIQSLRNTERLSKR